jgi:hypothetical protein
MKKMKKFLVWAAIVAVVGVVGFLFYSGRLDKEQAEQLGRQAYYGARGAADKVVSTDRVAPGDYGAAERCRANLREIERGKRLVGSNRGGVGAVSESEVEKALGKSIPKCPSGGRYSIRNLEYLPICSLANNGNLDPKDDHAILQY